MTNLNDSTFAAIRTALLAEREDIIATAESVAADDAALADARRNGEARIGTEGEGDNLSVDRELLSLLSGRAKESLIEVDSALDRLDRKTYGDCQTCQHPIPLERLEARPRTTMCVPCASRQRR